MPDEGYPARLELPNSAYDGSDLDDLLWPFGHGTPLKSLLLAEVLKAVKPRDFIERQFVSTCAQLMWQYRTVSIYYERILAHARDEGLEHLLAGPASTRRSEPSDFEITPSTRQAIEAVLARAGLDEDDVRARAFLVSLDEVQRIERLLAEYRREISRTLAAITRHRSSLGRQLAAVVALASSEVSI